MQNVWRREDIGRLKRVMEEERKAQEAIVDPKQVSELETSLFDMNAKLMMLEGQLSETRHTSQEEIVRLNLALQEREQEEEHITEQHHQHVMELENVTRQATNRVLTLEQSLQDLTAQLDAAKQAGNSPTNPALSLSNPSPRVKPVVLNNSLNPSRSGSNPSSPGVVASPSSLRNLREREQIAREREQIAQERAALVSQQSSPNRTSQSRQIVTGTSDLGSEYVGHGKHSQWAQDNISQSQVSATSASSDLDTMDDNGADHMSVRYDNRPKHENTSYEHKLTVGDDDRRSQLISDAQHLMLRTTPHFGLQSSPFPTDVERLAGVFVSYVSAGGPAYNGGLRSGCVVTSINGTALTKRKLMKQLCKTVRPGDVVLFEVVLNGGDKTNPQLCQINVPAKELDLSDIESLQLMADGKAVCSTLDADWELFEDICYRFEDALDAKRGHRRNTKYHSPTKSSQIRKHLTFGRYFTEEGY